MGPGLHIDKTGGKGGSLTGSPVLNLQELSEFPQKDIQPFERRLVKELEKDYIYIPDLVEGDVAPLDQEGGIGFWREFIKEAQVLWDELWSDVRNRPSMIASFYNDGSTSAGHGHNMIFGTNNNMLNTSESIIFARNSTFQSYTWQCLVLGTNISIVGGVRCVSVGNYNTINQWPNDSIQVGQNLLTQTSWTANFGSLNKDMTSNNGGEGAWNLISGNRNEIQGGRASFVTGKAHIIGRPETTSDGLAVLGVSSDWDTIIDDLGLDPVMIIGNGGYDWSEREALSRSNAFIVARTGEVIAPDLTNQKIADSPSGKTLVTRDYLSSNTPSSSSLAPKRLKNKILLSANWTLNQITGLYEYDFANENIKVTSSVDIIPRNESINEVAQAELTPFVLSEAGNAKIYAKNSPSGDISIDMVIQEVQDV